MITPRCLGHIDYEWMHEKRIRLLGFPSGNEHTSNIKSMHEESVSCFPTCHRDLTFYPVSSRVPKEKGKRKRKVSTDMKWLLKARS